MATEPDPASTAEQNSDIPASVTPTNGWWRWFLDITLAVGIGLLVWLAVSWLLQTFTKPKGRGDGK